MKEITIKNDNLAVKIAALGAEIQTVESLKDRYQYIWTADAKYWGRHAPVLFPFIGRSNNNQYLLNGNTYQMKQHGFLRDQVFTVDNQKEDQVTLTWHSNDETYQIYPYRFKATINYQLVNNQLKISYQIDNENEAAMYYSLGFHPGLNISSNLADYALKFTPAVSKLRTLLIDPAPFRSGQTKQTKLRNGELPLSYPMLDNGLIIYDAKNIRSVTLLSKKDSHSVTENLSDFPYLAIWSPEKKHAPFVCVEPFKGLPDKYGQPGELTDKDGESHIIGHQTAKIHLALKFA